MSVNDIEISGKVVYNKNVNNADCIKSAYFYGERVYTMSLKVMVCDDSMFVRKKMKDAVAAAGATEIIEAADGQQAIDKYKAEKPDLVFMDIIMPVKSGVEALTEIKAFDSNAKVVMASSVGTQENLKEAIMAGAYDFLQKPIANEDVAKIISKSSK